MPGLLLKSLGWRLPLVPMPVTHRTHAETTAHPLETLQRAHLIQRDRSKSREERYSPSHAFVSDYIRTQLWDKLPSTTRLTYKNCRNAYYIKSLRNDVDRTSTFPILDEWDNIRLDLEESCAAAKWDDLLALCNVLVGFRNCQLFMNGLWVYAKTALDYAVKATEESHQIDLQAKYHNGLGLTYYSLSEFESSRCCYQKVLEKTKDLRLHAMQLRGIGQVDYRLGNYNQSEEQYRQALELAQQLDDPQRIADISHQLGKIEYRRDKLDRAEELFVRALNTRRFIPEEWGIAKTLHELGRVSHKKFDYITAQDYYTQSLELRVRIGDRVGQQATLYQLGQLSFDQNKHAEARNYYEDCHSIATELNNHFWIAHVRYAKARLLFSQGKKHAALAMALASLSLCKQLHLGFQTEVEGFILPPEKWEKAQNYAADPKNFKLRGMVLELSSEHDTVPHLL